MSGSRWAPGSGPGPAPGIGTGSWDRNWLLGKNDNFYLGVGSRLKRLVGIGDEEKANDLLKSIPTLRMKSIPTLRIVNVGIAF